MHPKLEAAMKSIKLVERLFELDMYISLYDTNCKILYLYPDEAIGKMYVGDTFKDPTGALDRALATGEDIFNRTPSGKFDFDLEGKLAPIKDGDTVVGCVAVSYIPMSQKTLEAQQVALNSTYYLLLSVNPKTDKCIELHRSSELKRIPLTIVHFTLFREQMASYIIEQDREKFLNATDLDMQQETIALKRHTTCECRMNAPNMGGIKWIECTLGRASSKDTDGFEYLLMIRDIDERRSKQAAADSENKRLIDQLQIANERLFQKDLLDETVDLYNRKGFEYYSPAVLADANRYDKELFVYYTDMNGLKFINDTFGHSAGDKALLLFSKTLSDAAGTDSLCARMGGDEFLLVGSFPLGSDRPREIVAYVDDTLATLNKTSDLPYNVESSYGTYLGEPIDAKDIDASVKAADKNMYDMKLRLQKERGHLAPADDASTRALYFGKDAALVADEHAAERIQLKSLFDSDCKIIEAENGEEALEILKREKNLSVALISAAIPQVSAFQVLTISKAMEWNRELPMLLVCASDDDVTIQAGIAAGADDFIIKPFNPAIPKQRIRKIIDMHHDKRQFNALITERNKCVSKSNEANCLDGLDIHETQNLVEDMAKNVVAMDGVWFQALEGSLGMDIAMRADCEAAIGFANVEARRIKRWLKMPEHPGLEGLRQAICFKHNTLCNRCETGFDNTGALLHRVVDCRVQSARTRKNMGLHPCKDAAVGEFDSFAHAIDTRIGCECVSCFPDVTDGTCACAWRFTIMENEQPEATS